MNNVNSTVVSSPPHTSVGIGAGGVTAGAQGGSGNGGGVNSGPGGAITRVTLGFSVGESATHKSFSTSSVIF